MDLSAPPMSPEAKKRVGVLVLTFVGLLVICAMAALITWQTRRPIQQIIMSVALAASAGLLILVDVVNMRAKRARIPASIGMLAAIVALLGCIAIIWIPSAFIGPATNRYRERIQFLLVLSWVLACAFPVSGLLSFAQLSGRWGLVRLATLVAIWFLGVVILYSVFGGLRDWQWRQTVLVVEVSVSLAAAFGIVATIVLHFRSRIKFVVPAPVTVKSIHITCPACAKQQSLTLGDSACAQCRLRFHIEVEAPTCPGCGYLCFQLTSDRCPECGTSIAAVPEPS